MYDLDKQINELQGEYTKAMEESYQLEKGRSNWMKNVNMRCLWQIMLNEKNS